MSNPVSKDGYTRYIYEDSVHWAIELVRRTSDYFIARFPFVPDYHLCDFLEDGSHVCERPLQTFKTLTEALAVLRVLDASSPEARDG